MRWLVNIVGLGWIASSLACAAAAPVSEPPGKASSPSASPIASSPASVDAPGAPATATANPIAPIASPLAVVIESSERFGAFALEDGVVVATDKRAAIVGAKGVSFEPDLVTLVAKERGPKTKRPYVITGAEGTVAEPRVLASAVD